MGNHSLTFKTPIVLSFCSLGGPSVDLNVFPRRGGPKLSASSGSCGASGLAAGGEAELCRQSAEVSGERWGRGCCLIH